MDWQPMETAPRGIKRYIVGCWETGDGLCVGVCSYGFGSCRAEGAAWWHRETMKWVHPIMWARMPRPSKAAIAAARERCRKEREAYYGLIA